jgi:hypothetical protein
VPSFRKPGCNSGLRKGIRSSRVGSWVLGCRTTCAGALFQLNLLPRLWRKTSLANQNRMVPYEKQVEFCRRVRELMGSGSPADSCFNTAALDLFALQFQANPAYRRWCESRGLVPGGLDSWSQIPALPTSAFKEFDVSCLPTEKRAAVFHSSGTTGHVPSRHWHSPESLSLYEESLWHWFRRHFQLEHGAFSPRLTVLSPAANEVPHSSLAHMFETIRRQLGAEPEAFVGRAGEDGSWRLDADAFCQRIARGGVHPLPASSCPERVVSGGGEPPILIIGTAFSFVQLLDWANEHQLRWVLPPGSAVMETGGYKGRSRALPRQTLYELLSRLFGIAPSRIVSEYGMSELSSQAYDVSLVGGGSLGARRVFQFPPWARVRVVSPESGREVADGETGLLQVFDLANVFSVMAVQTEDLGVRRGSGFELVGRAEFAEQRGCSLLSAA